LDISSFLNICFGFLKISNNNSIFYYYYYYSVEKVLEQKCEKCEKVIEFEYKMRNKKLRIKVNVPIYSSTSRCNITPKIFYIFQDEWGLPMATFLKSKNEGQSLIECYIGVGNFDGGSCPDKSF
jgi:hypothetical protein